MRFVIEKAPIVAASIERIPAAYWRPEHLIVLCRPPSGGRLNEVGLAELREHFRDAAGMLSALWTTDFYQEWLITWQDVGSAPATGLAIAPGPASLPFLVDGMTLVPIRKTKTGTPPYASYENEVHAAMAAQIYKLDRLLTGAISVGMPIGARGDAPREARSVLMPMLVPLAPVLRKGSLRDDVAGADFYHKLRDEIGTGYVRKLFGQAKKTSAVSAGVAWLKQGAAMAGANPQYEDLEHQLPGIVAEINVLDAMISLRIRAAVQAAGERLANKLNPGHGPVSEEAAEAIAHDVGIQNSIAYETYSRPTPLMMTRIALELGLDCSFLYPNLAFMRPHLAAAVASGHAGRTGQTAFDPVGHWGLRGLLDVSGDEFVADEILDARRYLRPRVPHLLRSRALDAAPQSILSALDQLLAAGGQR